MRAHLRRFAYSPYAPRVVAEKITELLFLAGAAVTVWLCFGGPVFTLYAELIAAASRAAGTVA
jgi:hypothetical protein